MAGNITKIKPTTTIISTSTISKQKKRRPGLNIFNIKSIIRKIFTPIIEEGYNNNTNINPLYNILNFANKDIDIN